jgi:hypothetical protein
MSDKLGSLFTPFYGYVYESFIRDMGAVVSSVDTRIKASKDIKRSRERNEGYRQELTSLYVGLVLTAFQKLFRNDKEH